MLQDSTTVYPGKHGGTITVTTHHLNQPGPKAMEALVRMVLCITALPEFQERMERQEKEARSRQKGLIMKIIAYKKPNDEHTIEILEDGISYHFQPDIDPSLKNDIQSANGNSERIRALFLDNDYRVLILKNDQGVNDLFKACKTLAEKIETDANYKLTEVEFDLLEQIDAARETNSIGEFVPLLKITGLSRPQLDLILDKATQAYYLRHNQQQ